MKFEFRNMRFEFESGNFEGVNFESEDVTLSLRA